MPKTAARKAASQPMRTRALSRAAASVDVENRTFSAILTTETPVRTYIPDPTAKPDQHGCLPHIEVDEVLLTSGLDTSRVERMPLLACHGTHSLADYLGQVTAVRQETVEGSGSCVVIDAAFRPSQADMASDVAAGYEPLDIIAHSFGSLLLVKLLDRPESADFKFGRIVVAGSIVKPDYGWKRHIRSGRVEAVLNHCSR